MCNNRKHKDGKEYFFSNKEGNWNTTWHSPVLPAPEGTNHGSAGICFREDGKVLIVSADGGTSWNFAGGRPEPNESFEETFLREVLEEGCATVIHPILIGYAKGKCVEGQAQGDSLVRALWASRIEIFDWMPRHEMTDRAFEHCEKVLARIELIEGLRPIYNRWLKESIEAQKV